MYGETHERVVDVALIDAALVKPNPGFSSFLSFELLSPSLERSPFLSARVVPTMREKRIDLSESPQLGPLVESRIRRILGQLLFADLVERHVPGSRFSQMSK